MDQYPKALVERFAETHHGKTPSELIKESDRFNLKSNIFFFLYLSVTFGIYVWLILWFMLSKFHKVMGEGEEVFSLILTTALIFVLTSPLLRKASEYTVLSSDLGNEQKDFLENIEFAVGILSKNIDRQAILRMSIGQLQSASDTYLKTLSAKLKETETDYENGKDRDLPDLEWKIGLARGDIFETFNCFYALHLVEGRATRYLK